MPRLHQHDSCMAKNMAGSTREKQIHCGYLFFKELRGKKIAVCSVRSALVFLLLLRQKCQHKK